MCAAEEQPDINWHEEGLLELAKSLFLKSQVHDGSALLRGLLAIHALRVGDRSFSSARLHELAADIVKGRPLLRKHLRDRAISIYQRLDGGPSHVLAMLAQARDADDADDLRTAVTCTDMIIDSGASPEVIGQAYRIQLSALIRLGRLSGAQNCVEAFSLFASNGGSIADQIASRALQAELYVQRGLYLKALIAYKEAAARIDKTNPAILFLQINMAIMWTKMGVFRKALSLRREVLDSGLLERYDLLTGCHDDVFPGAYFLVDFVHENDFKDVIASPIPYHRFS